MAEVSPTVTLKEKAVNRAGHPVTKSFAIYGSITLV